MPASRLDQEVPIQAVGGLRRALGERLLAVVLFGSRARGDDQPWSDWDLLVIAEGLPENPVERQRLLADAVGAAADGSISHLARTPAEIERRIQSLHLDIALDGRILYDPRGYAAERLGSLRRLMKQVGLYREQTPTGEVWRWKREPSVPWVLGVGGWRMQAADDARYRLTLAERDLGTAERQLSYREWPPCIDHSQMAAENAAKAVLALLGPLGRTHDPGEVLERSFGRFPERYRDRVARLTECAKSLGSRVHREVSYGDEEKHLTPWDLFGEAEARDALRGAKEAVGLAKELVGERWSQP